MWEVPGGPNAAAGFEERASDALAAWRRKQLELPDYYLVMAPAQPGKPTPDLYLGAAPSGRAALPSRLPPRRRLSLAKSSGH
jgi:hypothetical protein